MSYPQIKSKIFRFFILFLFISIPFILLSDISTLIRYSKEIYQNGVALNDDHSLFVHTFQEQSRHSFSSESEKAAEIIEMTLFNGSSNNWVFTTDLNQIVVYYPTSKEEDLKKAIQLIEEEKTSYQINNRITKIVHIDSKDFDSENIHVYEDTFDSSTLQEFLFSAYNKLWDDFENRTYYISNFSKGHYLISGNHSNTQITEQFLNHFHNPSFKPQKINQLFYQVYDLSFIFDHYNFNAREYYTTHLGEHSHSKMVLEPLSSDSIIELICCIPGEWDSEESNVYLQLIDGFSKVFIKNKRPVLEDTQIILNTLILKNSNWITLNTGLLIKKITVNSEQDAKKIIAFCFKSDEINVSEFYTGHILIIIKSNELKSQIDSFLNQLENDH